MPEIDGLSFDMARARTKATIDPPRNEWKKPWSGYLRPRSITRRGSKSTITLANKKVGKSRSLRRNNPMRRPGPRWNGVNGIASGGYRTRLNPSVLLRVTVKQSIGHV